MGPSGFSSVFHLPFNPGLKAFSILQKQLHACCFSWGAYELSLYSQHNGPSPFRPTGRMHGARQVSGLDSLWGWHVPRTQTGPHATLVRPSAALAWPHEPGSGPMLPQPHAPALGHKARLPWVWKFGSSGVVLNAATAPPLPTFWTQGEPAGINDTAVQAGSAHEPGAE